MLDQLTPRGKKVLIAILIILFIAIVLFLENATTPSVCKTDAGKQTQMCKDLLYP